MIHWVSTIGDCRNYMNHIVSTKYLVSPMEFLQLYMAANVETQSLSRLAATNLLCDRKRTISYEQARRYRTFLDGILAGGHSLLLLRS
jgi:hypothetical protein